MEAGGAGGTEVSGAGGVMTVCFPSAFTGKCSRCCLVPPPPPPPLTDG